MCSTFIYYVVDFNPLCLWIHCLFGDFLRGDITTWNLHNFFSCHYKILGFLRCIKTSRESQKCICKNFIHIQITGVESDVGKILLGEGSTDTKNRCISKGDFCWRYLYAWTGVSYAYVSWWINKDEKDANFFFKF